jgi:hypothetical protein
MRVTLNRPQMPRTWIAILLLVLVCDITALPFPRIDGQFSRSREAVYAPAIRFSISPVKLG